MKTSGKSQVKKTGGLASSALSISATKTQKPKKAKTGGSWLKKILEFIFFLGWMACTGIAGYFLGHTPTADICPPELSNPSSVDSNPVLPIIPIVETVKCPGADISSNTPSSVTYEDINKQWTCSKAQADPSAVHKKLLPSEQNYDKTKWKSIITVDPKSFFDKYLSQYPGDIQSDQPVVVFSHKNLDSFSELPDSCKIMDVAIVPDSPGVCVAVTETFHDVASYHMMHADKQKDDTFALTANSNEGRTLPEEPAYAAARSLILSYFTYVDVVSKAVRNTPKYGQNKVTVGVLLESLDEVDLFKNSLARGVKIGISKNKYCAFTTFSTVNDALKSLGIKVIYIPELALVGTSGSGNVGYHMRRHFLQAWLAFAVANAQVKMMWQSPGTVLLERPDNIVNMVPIVEVFWSYKGRNDPRASPFFVSFDFFTPTGAERPVHLMHEILMHFDLVLAWASLDDVAAYRLSENNSRYGTTTHILPPSIALHTQLLGHDPAKIKDALASPNAPKVLVLPNEDLNHDQSKDLLKAVGLWEMDQVA